MRIAIINGPNLNLLGKREPEIYGSESFEEFFETLKAQFADHELSYHQTNHEGELVELIQGLGYSCEGIVLNPAAYTHTSVAIADAVSAVPAKLIEVHISNIFKREEFRHHSFVSPVAYGVICGLGYYGYINAINFLLSLNESD